MAYNKPRPLFCMYTVRDVWELHAKEPVIHGKKGKAKQRRWHATSHAHLLVSVSSEARGNHLLMNLLFTERRGRPSEENDVQQAMPTVLYLYRQKEGEGQAKNMVYNKPRPLSRIYSVRDARGPLSKET